MTAQRRFDDPRFDDEQTSLFDYEESDDGN